MNTLPIARAIGMIRMSDDSPIMQGLTEFDGDHSKLERRVQRALELKADRNIPEGKPTNEPSCPLMDRSSVLEGRFRWVVTRHTYHARCA